MRSAAPAQPAIGSGPWNEKAPASATAKGPGPFAVGLPTTGPIPPPEPPQRCRARPARATPGQPWSETPRKEWPGSGPSPVTRPRPAQAGWRAAAMRISLRLTIHDAWLSVDGTRRVVVGLESRAFKFSHIAKLAKGQPSRLLIQPELHELLFASRSSRQDSQSAPTQPSPTLQLLQISASPSSNPASNSPPSSASSIRKDSPGFVAAPPARQISTARC